MDDRELLKRLKEIQKLIEKHTTPPKTRGKYKGHGDSDPVAWLSELIRKENRERPKRKDYDENIWMASRLGFALLAWAVYVREAKAFDPRRPLALRLKERDRVRSFRIRVEEAIGHRFVDLYPLVREVFPDQEWEDPRSENATDGSFV